jgi:hypothetical protein
MLKLLYWVPALALIVFAGPLFFKKDEGPPPPPPPKIDEKPPPLPKVDVPEPAPLAVVEPVLYTELRHVINRGVELYNGGNIDACYRLFEGSLRTVKPLLKHRPELVKEIDSALGGVESNPVIWQRAFRLRAALDKVRATIKPGQRPPEKKADGMTEKKEKKDGEKIAPKTPEKKDKGKPVDPDGKVIE